jgi:hypothetical protein
MIILPYGGPKSNLSSANKLFCQDAQIQYSRHCIYLSRNSEIVLTGAPQILHGLEIGTPTTTNLFQIIIHIPVGYTLFCLTLFEKKCCIPTTKHKDTS